MKTPAIALCASFVFCLATPGASQAGSVSTFTLQQPVASSQVATEPAGASRPVATSPTSDDPALAYPDVMPPPPVLQDPFTAFLDETASNSSALGSIAPITTNDTGGSPSAGVSPSDVPSDEAVALWNALWGLFSQDGQGSGSQDMNFAFLFPETSPDTDSHPAHMHLPRSAYHSTDSSDQVIYFGDPGAEFGGDNFDATSDGPRLDGPVATPLPTALPAALLLFAAIFLSRVIRIPAK